MSMIDEQAVIDKLETLLATVPNVQAIYDGIPNSIATYPAIVLTPDGWEEEYADTRDTVELMRFKIVPFVNLTTNTLTAQATLRAIVKAIREIIGDQDNITLDGIVDSSRLSTGQYAFDQTETMQGSCEIVYSVRKRFNRFV